ncbi:MAG TPA: GNAT family N-acetyltransferase [Gemmataceae bacterium]|nr:GNAT family N-acetyltransferase [Gemmataceae bacterium]
MTTPFQVRPATIAEARVIARHRAEMFSDMGALPRSLYDGLVEGTNRFLERAMPAGDYLGWFAMPSKDDPREIVGGAGILLRRVPPHPLKGSEVRLAEGRQGLVMNVFTERPWRRRGVADLLMRHLLAWASDHFLDTLVLHASAEGLKVYERLGFVATNEMRYAGPLSTPRH